MPDPVLSIDVSDRVAVVTLNRPDARNALSRELLAALPEGIAACDADDDVDVIILTGADPAFCAGIDLESLASGRVAEAPSTPSTPSTRPSPAAGSRQEPFARTRTPLIAAVNGAAVTGGLEVVLACDFVVASERARFADTHARVGIMPGWGLTVRLAEAERHRQLRRCPHRVRLGPGESRGRARGTVAVLPHTRGRHRVERPARRPRDPRDL